jgi:hypothetical protein
MSLKIRVITKLPNSEQSYKGKVKTHKYINRQNQSTPVFTFHLVKAILDTSPPQIMGKSLHVYRKQKIIQNSTTNMLLSNSSLDEGI